MVYFTSDLHFDHANIIRYDNRPFKDVNEMNTDLIRRWNARVKEDDTVYILGDFSWSGPQKTEEILKQLTGKKILVKGNHDNRWYRPGLRKYFEDVCNRLEIPISGCNYPCTLSHSPVFFHTHQHRGAVMLYGHVHNSAEHNMVESFRKTIEQLEAHPCYMFNVGCMHWDYAPVTLEEMMATYQPSMLDVKEE